MYIRIFFGLLTLAYRSRRCVVVHAAEANMSMICFKITLSFHNGTSSQRIYISGGSPQNETRKWKYLNIFCLYAQRKNVLSTRKKILQYPIGQTS